MSSKVSKLCGYEMRCCEEYRFVDAFGQLMRLVAGERYLVSRARNGMVTVFGEPMMMAPARLFEPAAFASVAAPKMVKPIRIRAA